jgi:hypothetical protein
LCGLSFSDFTEGQDRAPQTINHFVANSLHFLVEWFNGRGHLQAENEGVYPKDDSGRVHETLGISHAYPNRLNQGYQTVLVPLAFNGKLCSLAVFLQCDYRDHHFCLNILAFEL